MLSALLGLGFFIAVGFIPTHVLANEKSPAYAKMVHKFAYKFDLHEMDVKAMFAAVRDERRLDLESKVETRLAEAVKDGVLSESQKDEFIKRLDQHLTSGKRSKPEIHQWFRDQGIDPKKIKDYMSPEGHRPQK